ncbi:MAG: DUF2953 domain-containing protein [Candidatus Methanoperedens sp.]|nr:DUF2953 domain-containing protein [Candidatus Methanoperedens sp.]MCZ7371481.1 DUF2953 domain-containing protein [Candidatus Methanoperedens sp.]
MISIILLIIIVLAIAALLFPVTIAINSIRSGQKITGSLQLNWTIFILLYSLKERQLEILIFGRRIFRHLEKKKPTPEHPKKPEKLKRHWAIKDFFNLAGPMLQLLKELVYAFRFKYIRFDITFGLNNPACTGILTGFLHAVGLSQMGNVRWAPDFTRQVMDWNLEAKTSVIPIRLLPPFAKFITNSHVNAHLLTLLGHIPI